MNGRDENTHEIITRYQRDSVHMEMGPEAFGLLETILWQEHGLELLVTRASVSDKIVAVIKKERDDA